MPVRYVGPREPPQVDPAAREPAGVAPRELVAQRARDGLAQAPRRLGLVALHRDEVLPDVDDAPADERIHQHRAVALREEAQRLGVVEGLDAHIEVAHVLHQRQLEIQARLGLDRNNLT